MSVALGQPPPARIGLSALCLAHSALFAWAALALPWRFWTTLTLSLTLLSLLHLITAGLALARTPLLLCWAWRALSLCSLLVFLGLGWSIAAAALYVSKLYLGLGTTLASALWAAEALLALTTLPIAIWGAARTLPARTFSAGRSAAGAVLLTLVCGLSLPLMSRAAVADAAPNVDSALLTELGTLLEAHAERPGVGQRLNVSGAGAAHCEKPIGGSDPTLLVTYVSRGRGVIKAWCLQQPSASKLQEELSRVLRRYARPGSALVVDVITASKHLSASLPFLDALKLRPGIDGVCEGELCLPAWQLVLRDSFGEHRLLPSVPSITYGFSPKRLRQALGTLGAADPNSVEGLVRIETESFAVDSMGSHRLTRTRPVPPALSKYGVERAIAAAQRFLVAAQQPDGAFRYALDPLTGTEDKAKLDLTRQAGTAYALCEQSDDSTLLRSVGKAVSLFHAHERRFGDVSALSEDESFSLADSVYPLLAMLRCRNLLGTGNDRLIGQLSRLALRLQRTNGSFLPAFDPRSGRETGGAEEPHAAGRALLALVLLEQVLPQLEGSAAEPLPTARMVRAAVDSAMSFYSGLYWPTLLRDTFFFDEGWHCLTARTALTSHRNDAYERLCLDYVASRARWVLGRDDTPEPYFVGGSSVIALFPPQHAAAAGFCEALEAAIAIKLKRGTPVAADLSMLRDVTAFLLRAQWRPTGCYACKHPEQVVGGFSQHLAASAIRTEDVQHAMAALAKGARGLQLE